MHVNQRDLNIPLHSNVFRVKTRSLFHASLPSLLCLPRSVGVCYEIFHLFFSFSISRQVVRISDENKERKKREEKEKFFMFCLTIDGFFRFHLKFSFILHTFERVGIKKN